MYDEIEISVILPMYNSEDTIIHALNSIYQQTKKQYIKEIIVVNDGSIDKSEQLVLDYKKTSIIPIRLFNQENQGVSHARNVGLRNALGNYIAFLDSDDVWNKDKIEIQVDTLKNNPHILFLGGCADNKIYKSYFKKIDSLHNITIRELCFRNYPPTPTIIFKKECIAKVGYFDEEQRYGEDINYFQRFCTIYQNYYVLPISLMQIGVYNKEYYDDSGLSSNLSQMHFGSLLNIKSLYLGKHLNTIEYSLFYIYYWLKYFKRVLRKEFRKFRRKVQLWQK